MDCSFKVNIAGVEVCFSDRVYEVHVLSEWINKSKLYPIAVYGPEGCGKTTLFKYFTRRMREEGYTSIYVNALGVRGR